MNQKLRLKKNETRRLLAGHLWVFSNEVDISVSPLKSFAPGEPVEIESSNGRRVGYGYVNPHSLIAARLCSYKRPCDAAWLENRLASALALREALYDAPFYRLVHGEGDYIPGLVIDRFDDVLVVQITTAGIEHLKSELTSILVDLFNPSLLLFRNDNAIRELEGLELYQETAVGSWQGPIGILENGCRYEVDEETAQKTGWFYDHRDNRSAVARFAKDRRVLDCYAYAGAWGINALLSGAKEVIAIDSSTTAMACARSNASLNGFSDRYSTVESDVVESLRQMSEDGERFDMIVLDPPAFIKRKKDYKAGLQYYGVNNRLAMSLLAPGGLLVSASCSQSLESSALSDSMLKGARRLSIDLRLLNRFGQGLDHPVHPAMSETRYLKGFMASVS